MVGLCPPHRLHYCPPFPIAGEGELHQDAAGLLGAVSYHYQPNEVRLNQLNTEKFVYNQFVIHFKGEFHLNYQEDRLLAHILFSHYSTFNETLQS